MISKGDRRWKAGMAGLGGAVFGGLAGAGLGLTATKSAGPGASKKAALFGGALGAGLGGIGLGYSTYKEFSPESINARNNARMAVFMAEVEKAKNPEQYFKVIWGEAQVNKNMFERIERGNKITFPQDVFSYVQALGTFKSAVMRWAKDVDPETIVTCIDIIPHFTTASEVTKDTNRYLDIQRNNEKAAILNEHLREGEEPKPMLPFERIKILELPACNNPDNGIYWDPSNQVNPWVIEGDGFFTKHSGNVHRRLKEAIEDYVNSVIRQDTRKDVADLGKLFLQHLRMKM